MGGYFDNISFIKDVINSFDSDRKIIAIDGRCASGKTTLAGLISQEFLCPVIHTDDFFMPISKQGENREEIFCGNLDYVRLKKEITTPLSEGVDIKYHKFCCRSQQYSDEILINKPQMIIIEGAYSTHPIFDKYFDISIFADVQKDEQKQRLIAREGKIKYTMFENRWIPLEEAYIKQHTPDKKADFLYFAK